MSHPSYGHRGPRTAHHVLPASPARLLLLAVVVVVFLDQPSTKESQNICPRVCACREGPGDACRDLGLRGGEGRGVLSTTHSPGPAAAVYP